MPVLKSMKETSDEAYNNFIASMDNNLAVIQKSGLLRKLVSLVELTQETTIQKVLQR